MILVPALNLPLLSKKPSWLDKKINLNFDHKLKELLRGLRLHTVCEESGCPNISECFSRKVATFLILGDSCTRKCSFCGLEKQKPHRPDSDEPKRVAQAVKLLNLDYIVVTSPTRDDLADGGAGHFSETTREILKLGPKKRVELLIPDFLRKKASLEKIASSGAKIIAHNLETVPSLYKEVRPGVDYKRSLAVLAKLKQLNPKISTKSGLMLGLGEEEAELKPVFKDLRSVDCDFLTLGQYLPPSLNHYPVKSYILPETFDQLKEYALALGFRAISSGPYVRSSYLADLMA